MRYHELIKPTKYIPSETETADLPQSVEIVQPNDLADGAVPRLKEKTETKKVMVPNRPGLGSIGC